MPDGAPLSGAGGNVNSVIRRNARLPAALLPVLLFMPIACEKSENAANAVPVAQLVVWAGQNAQIVTDSIPLDTVEPASVIRVHRLAFQGREGVPFVVSLREYRADHWSYAAWLTRSAGETTTRGAMRSGSSWIFSQGRFLGIADTAGSGISVAAFRENLVFAGEPEFPVPVLFSSFPLLGRISKSERVVNGEFLGYSWSGPVFSAEFHCHDDTATAFRASPQNAESLRLWMLPWKGTRDSLKAGHDWHFHGVDEFHRPMIFWVFSGGVAGFSGCYDPVLEKEYVEKLEKTQIFWRKP